METLLAVDVGGTEIKAALVDPGGRELSAVTVPTPRGAEDSGASILDTVTSLIPALVPRGLPTPSAAGLVVPGIVDETAGVGVYSSNLGWRHYPFRDEAAARWEMPVGFGHDVAMAGEAELAAGAAPDDGDTAVVVIGTGIAAALFDAGRRLRGAGFAGELGHLTVPYNGGSRLLEQVASASAIGREFARLVGRPPTGAREVFKAAADGGPDVGAAREVLDRAFDALAHALLEVSTLLGTENFVLTGGLARAGEALRQPVEERLRAGVAFQRAPWVRLGVLGARAGLAGAVECARRAARPTPALHPVGGNASGTA